MIDLTRFRSIPRFTPACLLVAAAATVDAAGREFDTKGANVVRAAWKQVGIEVKGASPRKTPKAEKVKAKAKPKSKGASNRADTSRPERGHRRAS